jgi:N-acetylneuraminate synthase
MSTVIISEIGINHNGDINIAKELIKGAKDCGCDLVKFQKRNINCVYTKAELDKYRESPFGLTNRDQKLGLELSKADYDIIDSYCKEIGIEWFATPWDLDSVKFLDMYNLKYNKVASAMLFHDELLHAIASRKKYTFISTGMTELYRIAQVVNIFRSYDCPFELMHCNSTYPMKDENANLRCIETLRRVFDCKVGYSGHEVGIITTVAAATLGATSVERHITLGRSMYGSDQGSSLELVGLKKMVDYIRTMESALGDGKKVVYPEELEAAKKLQRTHDYSQ